MQNTIDRNVSNKNLPSEYQGYPATRIADRFLMSRGRPAVSFEAGIESSMRKIERMAEASLPKLKQMAEELERDFGQRARCLQAR